MTQHEAEGLIQILKRRKAEEVTLIEQKWEAERQRLESDRTHSMNRVHENMSKAHIRLVEAKEAVRNTHGDETWKEKKLQAKRIADEVNGYHRELASLNRYYQEEFRHVRDKRDEELRKLITKNSEERQRILSQVIQPNREDQVKYWRHKYYKLKAEVDKTKENVA